ncbi:MAG: hypothetical protein QOE19_2440 [Actinomycetota bacterium]|jgi:hypothetical protein|nr:hypothetical protein [Actinomycetota bacterium]MDQ1664484.1 hypothetical protein [Actinomycetota bacterium]
MKRKLRRADALRRLDIISERRALARRRAPEGRTRPEDTPGDNRPADQAVPDDDG